MKTRLFTLIVLTCFFSLTAPGQAIAATPWRCAAGETLMTGFFREFEPAGILLETARGPLTIPLASEPLLAVMGTSSGMVLEAAQFPKGIGVEVYLDEEGRARAMRNIPVHYPVPGGQSTELWGHDAMPSPAGNAFLLFHYGQGLYLHTPDSSPVYLSDSPLAAWNNNGRKIAFLSADRIRIYDLNTRKSTNLQESFHLFYASGGQPEETSTLELTPVVFSLQWSPDDSMLLCTSLQDRPDLDSDVFLATVLDIRHDQTLIQRVVTGLVTASWLDNTRIVLSTSQDLNCDNNSLQYWDIVNDFSAPLLPESDFKCQEIAVNIETGFLAFIQKALNQYHVYLLDLKGQQLEKIATLPLPVRNLQWSSRHTLLYWDEFNNLIYEIKNLQEKNPVVRAYGYLPPLGGSGENFLFFAAEPFEEPQPLYWGQEEN